MQAKESGLRLDQNELTRRTFGILEHRDQYFLDLVNQIRKRYPALKIIYANSTSGTRLNPDRPTPDFIIIMKGTLKSNRPGLPDKSIIMIEAPPIFTERTLAGWTLSVEKGNMDGYFAYMLDSALRIDESKFIEYLVHMCLLSLDPKNTMYWKKPENGEILAKEIMELYARYNNKGKSRIEAARGYSDPNVVRQMQNQGKNESSENDGRPVFAM